MALWSLLIQTAGSLGLHSSCSYHLARWPHRRAALVTWFKRIAAVQAVAMTAVSIAVLWWFHLRRGVGTLLTVEYTSWAAAATIGLYGVMYAQGSSDFARFNRTRLIASAMPGALIAVGTLALRLTPAETGAAYLIPTWCSAGLAARWLHRASRGARDAPLSPGELRSVWSYGWRSVASLSGLLVNTSADQYTLGFLGSASSLGLYSVGASAAAPMPTLIASLGMVGLPTIAPLTGRAKAKAAWRTLRRAACLLVLLAPPAAALLPWAIPWVFGARYSAAVVPAEVLLLGSCFAALTTVVDALLRAYGLPGFVCVTQGAGGILTIAGTLLIGGRPLRAVALVSSLGFAVTFVLALARLWAVTRTSRRAPGTAAPYLTRARAADAPYQPAHARPRSVPVGSTLPPGGSRSRRHRSLVPWPSRFTVAARQVHADLGAADRRSRARGRHAGL